MTTLTALLQQVPSCEKWDESERARKWEVRSHDRDTDPLMPYDAVSKIEQSESG